MRWILIGVAGLITVKWINRLEEKIKELEARIKELEQREP